MVKVRPGAREKEEGKRKRRRRKQETKLKIRRQPFNTHTHLKSQFIDPVMHHHWYKDHTLNSTPSTITSYLKLHQVRILSANVCRQKSLQRLAPPPNGWGSRDGPGGSKHMLFPLHYQHCQWAGQAGVRKGRGPVTSTTFLTPRPLCLTPFASASHITSLVSRRSSRYIHLADKTPSKICNEHVRKYNTFVHKHSSEL